MNVFIWKPCIDLHWLWQCLRPWVGLSDIIIQNLSQNSCCSASGHQTSTSAAKLAGMLACKIFSWKMLILNLMHWLAHYIQRRDFFLIGNPEEELWKSSFVKKSHSAVPCKGGGQNMPDFCWYSTLLLELQSLSLDFLMNSIQVIRL